MNKRNKKNCKKQRKIKLLPCPEGSKGVLIDHNQFEITRINNDK